MYTLHNMFLKKKFTTIIIVKSGLDAKTLIDGNEIFGQHKGSFTQPLVPIKILHSNQPNSTAEIRMLCVNQVIEFLWNQN